jgi:hypothetical protein
MIHAEGVAEYVPSVAEVAVTQLDANVNSEII